MQIDLQKELDNLVTSNNTECDNPGELLANSIGAYRYLSYEAEKYPEKVLDKLKDASSAPNVQYYPCDIIDLRQILKYKEIFSCCPILLSDLNFAKEYFVDYSVLIGVSTKPIDSLLVRTNRLSHVTQSFINLNNTLHSIVLNSYQIDFDQKNKVIDIIREYDETVGIEFLYDAPWLKNEKLASTQSMYNVTVEALGIKDEKVKANNDVEALNKVLNEAWHQKNKGDHKPHPKEYQEDYWLKFKGTPFWNAMVKKADASTGERPGQHDGYEGDFYPNTVDEYGTHSQRALSPFQKGDKVKMRHGGMGMPQAKGRVIQQTNEAVKIRWESGKYKGKVSVFSLARPEYLHSILQKDEIGAING